MNIAPKINTKDIDVSGTSLKGYITITFQELKKKLGEPLKGSADGKTTAEWNLKFKDGTIATIYDWKVSKTPTDLYDWQIGGHSLRAVELVETFLERYCRVSPF